MAELSPMDIAEIASSLTRQELIDLVPPNTFINAKTWQEMLSILTEQPEHIRRNAYLAAMSKKMKSGKRRKEDKQDHKRRTRRRIAGKQILFQQYVLSLKTLDL
jgi:hypothetical protein